MHGDTPSARTIGEFARLACTWEVLARKAGNVCPGREFPDLTVDDFLKSAAAIAPVLDQAPRQPLGITILRSIEETRKVVNTNTNLGIVLLLAPLASVPLDEPLEAGVARVLKATTVEDSRNVYAAIRLAKPGGLGAVEDQDVRIEPTLPLRQLMALASARDSIASQYNSDFGYVFFLASELGQMSPLLGTIEEAIFWVQLLSLSLNKDSLIRRKCGEDAAERVRKWVTGLINEADQSKKYDGLRDLDHWLRHDNHARNPGTTADLLAAALFVSLRNRTIDPKMPFTWPAHPFEIGA